MKNMVLVKVYDVLVVITTVAIVIFTQREEKNVMMETIRMVMDALQTVEKKEILVIQGMVAVVRIVPFVDVQQQIDHHCGMVRSVTLVNENQELMQREHQNVHM